MLKYHNLLSLCGMEGKAGDRLFLASVLIVLETLFAFSYAGDITLSGIAVLATHIIVIVAAMLLGPVEGGLAGLVLGMASICKTDALRMLYADSIFSPFVSGSLLERVVLFLGSGILYGAVAGFLFSLLFKYGGSRRRAVCAVGISLFATFLRCLFIKMPLVSVIVIFLATTLAVFGLYQLWSGKKVRQLYEECMELPNAERGRAYLFFWGSMAAVGMMLTVMFLHMDARLEDLLFMEQEALGAPAVRQLQHILLQLICVLTIILFVVGIFLLRVCLQKMSRDKRVMKLAGEVELEKRVSQMKTQFLSAASLDIRTSMNAIRGMTDIASAHAEEPERVRECLDKIDIFGEHLMSMTNKVLDMSRIGSGTVSLVIEEFRLTDMLKRLETIIQPLAQAKKQELEVKTVSIRHEVVMGDMLRLQQVLVNLLENAVKYTPQGGKILFEVREQESLKQSSSYEFIVTDNGIGMSEEFVERIFEPFTREENSRVGKAEGTVLGMTIARNIVQMMQGELSVESRLGQGSRIKASVCLEWREERGIEEKIPHMNKLIEKAYAGKRVLLADDNWRNLEIEKEIIEMTGALVEVAYNGEEAMEKVLASPEGYYDIVLMDIQMPVMNGYEAALEIRKSGRADLQSLPIVAVTADAFAEDASRAERAGMNGHITRPIDMDRLEQCLEHWLDQR